jgi:chromosome segregation ATPase
VAIESSSGARSDLVRLVEWLDEQRQLDHERLIQLARVVDQMRTSVRDQAATLTHVESTASSRGPADGRSGDEIGKVADRLVLVERTLSEHIESQSRMLQAEAALHDRERRQFAELTLQVEALARTIESTNGRALAVAEEVRHERDARAPLVQSIDELERGAAAVTSRIGALDQMVRRLNNLQSVFEQTEDKRWSDLSRIDQQTKLLDLRLGRELVEIRKFVDDSRATADEALKPVDLLQRMVNQLVQDLEVLQTRVVGLGQAVDELADRISVAESQARSDRSVVDRLGEALEQLSRRLETSGGNIWQLGERLGTIADDLNRLRGETRGIREQSDGLIRRLERGDDERRRIDGVSVALEAEIDSVRKVASDEVVRLRERFELELEAIAAKLDARRRVGIDHLRRTIDELSEQFRELETEKP